MHRFIITISKEYLKFSSAHFTIFSDSSLEYLHGHNYQLSLRIECRDAQNGITMEFGQLKKILRGLCDQLDEKILLPTESRFLRVSKSEEHFDVVFTGAGFIKSYRFPCEDVAILPVPNITSEMLAQYLCGEFRKKIESAWDHTYGDIETMIASFEIEIEETPGQAVAYVWQY